MGGITAISILKDIAFLGVGISLIYYVAASVAAARFARRSSKPPLPVGASPLAVAMLKPLHGLSASLRQNLASFFNIDYPRASLVFGVSAPDDPTVKVIQSLAKEHGVTSVAITATEEPNASNRKVAKLIGMAREAAEADIFVLSDADVSVEPNYLRRLVGELSATPQTGMVTCLYRARPVGGIGSQLEASFINTDFLPLGILSAAIEPMRHAFGATIAVKREALKAAGGFEAIKYVLADDFFLGRGVVDQGYEVRLSNSLVTVNCEENSFKDFWIHQLRWARTYRRARPLSVLTIATHGPFWAILLLLASGFSAVSVWALVAVLASRTAMCAFLMSRVLGLTELLPSVWTAPLKDLVMTGVWFASLGGRHVLWGGRRFRVMADGSMIEVPV